MVFEPLKHTAEMIVLYGSATMATLYGLKRIYTAARNIEKLVENSTKNEVLVTQTSSALCAHVTAQTRANETTNKQLDRLASDMSQLTVDLKTHMAVEETNDKIKDKQLLRLSDHMSVIISTIEANGIKKKDTKLKLVAPRKFKKK